MPQYAQCMRTRAEKVIGISFRNSPFYYKDVLSRPASPPVGRLREVLLAEGKVVAHLKGKLAKGVRQPGFQRNPVGGWFRNQRLAKGDPDRNAAARTPEARENIAPVAAHDHAWDNGSGRYLRNAGNAGP